MTISSDKNDSSISDKDHQRSSSRPPSAQGNFLRAHANTGPTLLRSQSVTDLRPGSIGTFVDVVRMNSFLSLSTGTFPLDSQLKK